VAFVKELLWFLQLHLWLFVFLSSRGRCHASDPVMTALLHSWCLLTATWHLSCHCGN